MDSIKKDTYLLFTARIVRLFAYGFLSVILVLYLSAIGFNEFEIGLLITLTLIGDAVISFWITTRADSYGRKSMLILGAVLMAVSGFVFILTSNFWLLVVSATIGVLSPTGKEIGPFLSIEQSALAQLLKARALTKTFAWYNLAGSFATASGALAAGWLNELLKRMSFSGTASYKIIIAGYGALGLLILILFCFLSGNIEVKKSFSKPAVKSFFGLHSSKKIVAKLSALFALDAFAGGFIIQSFIAYWFYLKFNIDTGLIGSILFGANLVAGISALFAVKIANKFGLLRTMVFTHLPSNILLLLVPLMPDLVSASILFILRFSISQMDVPSRQAYTILSVEPDERSAASGISTIARSIGASVSPSFSGLLLSSPLLISFPFFLAGGLKIIYDLWLYFSFYQIKEKLND